MSRFHNKTWSMVHVSLVVWLCLLATAVLGHEARPVAVDIVETAANQFVVRMKMPNALPVDGLPRLAMPDFCSELTEPVFIRGRNSYLLKADYQCRQRLANQTLTLAFPGNQASTNTLFRLTLQSGEYYSQLLSPTEREWRIPEHENRFQIAQQYSELGIRHIFSGIDHLLFIACLIFIAGTWRRILVTITGFTLAHSLTLFLSILDVITVPVPPVEAVIALSILFLAQEIAVANHHSWTWRYPIAVSCSFGLLHGFGFAAVLKNVGLPQTELVTGLLFFNVGVEIGQVVFIALLLISARLLSRVAKRCSFVLRGGWVRNTLNYVIGTVAAYWFISRMLLI